MGFRKKNNELLENSLHPGDIVGGPRTVRVVTATRRHRRNTLIAWCNVAMGASDAVGIGAFPLENGYVYQIRDGLKSRANEVVLL